MKKIFLKLLFTFLTTSLFALPVIGAELIELTNPLKAPNLVCFIFTILNILWYLAVVIAPLMIVVAGFMLTTSLGNQESIKTAKNLILWSLIGLVVIFLSRAIIVLFLDILTPSGSVLPPVCPT